MRISDWSSDVCSSDLLYTANGWAWLAEWVHDGRFRPVYVPAGVVTGRWASSGGGALQIPRQLRAAARADPGWCFVLADVAQMEPPLPATLSRHTPVAAARRGPGPDKRERARGGTE